MSKLIFAAAALAALLDGQAVAADSHTVAVPTAGVNFNSQAEAQAFYVRVQNAAVRACQTDSTNRYVAQADRGCVEAAVASAVRSADRPLLTAAYQGAPSASATAMATNEQ